MEYETAEMMVEEILDKVYDESVLSISAKFESLVRKSVTAATEKATGAIFEDMAKEAFISEFERKYIETIEEVASTMAVKIANATADPNKIRCYQDERGQVHVDLSELLSAAKPKIKIESV